MTPVNLPIFRHCQFPHIFLAIGPSKERGVAIAIKDSVQFTQLETHMDTASRFIILICEINQVKYTLVNLYLPNTKQISFLNKIWKKISTLWKGHLNSCGDFNAIPNINLDLSGAKRHRKCRATLAHFISSSNLFDIWNSQHSPERDFTFFSKAHYTYSRIDLFLVDKFLLQKVTKSDIH